MLNPTPYFAADFFATRDVTLKRLQKFAREVLTRLQADNPGGVFTALLTDLTAQYEALFGSVLLADQGTSTRRGSAQLMWGALEELQDQLEDDEDLINYKSKKQPQIRQAFFPNGRNEYSNATLLTADLLFARAEQAAQAHTAALGPDFDAARYTTLRTQFATGRDGTGAGDEQAAKARAQASSQRDDLTERLTDAVKLVAAQFPRDEARCAAFFRFELLQPGQHDQPEKPTAPRPTPAAV